MPPPKTWEASLIKEVMAAGLVIAVSLASRAGSAADIKILSVTGMREVITELQPHLVRVAGQQVSVSFESGADLSRRIQGGESVDVVVVPRVTLDRLLAEGNIVPGSVVDISQSSMGIAVRNDAAKPDISSPEKFKQALLAAKAIVITDPASGGIAGVHIADVFRRLGIMDDLAPKLKLARGQRNATFVARGEADIAVQLSSEIRIVPGVEFIPLPAEFERTFVFSAGLGSNAHEVTGAKAILQALTGTEALAVARSNGMDPPSSR
jgi:molybdate transport system substrate-binding protein